MSRCVPGLVPRAQRDSNKIKRKESGTDAVRADDSKYR